MKDNLLKIEHEFDALEKHNAELEEQVATYKAKVAEYAGIVKEMRRDMDGMSQLIKRMRKEKSELLQI